jgi:hypothetical protein
VLSVFIKASLKANKDLQGYYSTLVHLNQVTKFGQETCFAEFLQKAVLANLGKMRFLLNLGGVCGILYKRAFLALNLS